MKLTSTPVCDAAALIVEILRDRDRLKTDDRD